MSYTNQTVSSMADFIDKLQTFLSGTPGWTIDDHTPASGRLALTKSTVRIAMQWDTSNPNSLGLYQYEGAVWNGSNSPWAQNNDSGNGGASTSEATLALGRRAVITNTPVQFWCFEDDTYVHVVVQVNSTPRFEHFGFGILDKIGTWTGGEYCYGYRHASSGSSAQLNVLNSVLLGNSVESTSAFMPTVHIEGVGGTAGTDIWAVCAGENQSAAQLGTDRAGNDRTHVIGGSSGGYIGAPLGNRFVTTKATAFTPMTPVVLYFYDRTDGNLYGPIGSMKDVRFMSCRYYEGGDEFQVGGDTWVVFPTRTKAEVVGAQSAGRSGYAGLAYKKVTT